MTPLNYTTQSFLYQTELRLPQIGITAVAILPKKPITGTSKINEDIIMKGRERKKALFRATISVLESTYSRVVVLTDEQNL